MANKHRWPSCLSRVWKSECVHREEIYLQSGSPALQETWPAGSQEVAICRKQSGYSHNTSSTISFYSSFNSLKWSLKMCYFIFCNIVTSLFWTPIYKTITTKQIIHLVFGTLSSILAFFLAEQRSLASSVVGLFTSLMASEAASVSSSELLL